MFFFKDFLINNADLVATSIMHLLKNCPPEVVSVRKDLLAISRHIITDLRTSNFFLLKLLYISLNNNYLNEFN